MKKRAITVHSRGKIFTFRMENGYSLENFRSSMLVDLHCQSIIPYFVGKDLQLSEKPPLKCFAVYVYGTVIVDTNVIHPQSIHTVSIVLGVNY